MITAEELAIIRKPEVQKYIREKMGEWRYQDSCWCANPSCQKVKLFHNLCNTRYGYELLRIPDCISRDSERPERGLAGMLNGEFIIQRWTDGWSVTIAKPEMKMFEAETPRLALLEALEWQIGRKS